MPLRVLLSYWYYKDADVERLLADKIPGYDLDLLADSGAFSAHSQGVSIDVADYIAWVKRWEHLFTSYINLDVIHNAEASWENQKKMEAAGLHPMPVFHVLEDFAWLDRYLDAGYRYIGLGGIAMAKPAARLPWLVKCFLRGRQAGAVFHGLGVTSEEALGSLPWFSVDSSSWAAGVMYGNLRLFDPKTGRGVVIQTGNHAQVYRYSALIRDYGFDPADFATRARCTRENVLALALCSILQTEAWMRRRHGPVIIPGGTGHSGIYIARTNGDDGAVKIIERAATAGPKVYTVDVKANNGNDIPVTLDAIGQGCDRVTGPKLYIVEAFTMLRQPAEAIAGLATNGLTDKLERTTTQ